MSCYVSFVPEAEVVEQILNVGSWPEITPTRILWGSAYEKTDPEILNISGKEQPNTDPQLFISDGPSETE